MSAIVIIRIATLKLTIVFEVTSPTLILSRRKWSFSFTFPFTTSTARIWSLKKKKNAWWPPSLMPSFCKRRSCIPRSQTTCQSLHLVKAELEVNLGLLTLAAGSQNCRRVSPFPTPRLAWASQCRNSESNCPWLKFIRNTPCWSSNPRQASPSSSSSFIWQVGRITESHRNWGFVRATLEEGGTPYQ